MIHRLKTWPEYFSYVVRNEKDFEVRKNDRNYRVGDILILKEWDPAAEIQEGFTGRSIERRVKFILVGGQFGIDKDYVVLGLEEIKDRPNKPQSFLLEDT